MKEYLTDYKPIKWVEFYKGFSSGLYIEEAGYFDERPLIHIGLTQLIVLLSLPLLLTFSFWFLILTPFILFGWGKMYIHLPIKTGIEDCESGAWGINYHNQTLWFYIGRSKRGEGREWITISMPWQYTWYRKSTLLEDFTYHHEIKRRSDIDENKVWRRTYVYKDKYDNTYVNATISVVEREWRMRFLMWTNLFNLVRKEIEIEFDKEVGKQKGSWKGGCLGCGYTILPYETPYQTLLRMEREREF